MRKAPRRGLRLAKFQFLLFLLVCFLLPDVIADDLFRHTKAPPVFLDTD